MRVFRKRVIAAVSTAMMLITAIPANPAVVLAKDEMLQDLIQEEQQDNENELKLETEKTCVISEPGEKVRYEFIPEETGTYVFQTLGASVDTEVTLLDSKEQELSYDNDSGDELNCKVEFNLVADEKYAFVVGFFEEDITGEFGVIVEQNEEITEEVTTEEMSSEDTEEDTFEEYTFEEPTEEPTSEEPTSEEFKTEEKTEEETEEIATEEDWGNLDAETIAKIRDEKSKMTAMSNGFKYYILDDGTANINDYVGEETNIVVPAIINGYKVSTIGFYAFYGNNTIEKVTISDGIETIKEGAFERCEKLKEITVASSVKMIQNFAFEGCKLLSTISIKNANVDLGYSVVKNTAWYDKQPDGLLYIGNTLYAYKGTMPQNTTITIKKGTIAIGHRAFEKCEGMVAIKLPNGLVEIKNEAFAECRNLKEIVIPSSVKRIGHSVFYENTSLNNVTLPEGITEITGSMFGHCTALKSVKIPSTVTIISAYAFTNSGIESIEIPDGVTEIDQGAFQSCTSLQSVKLPLTLKQLKDGCFSSCTQLENITIPSGTTTLGYYVFSKCYTLKNIQFPKTVTSMGGEVFNETAWLKSQPNGVVYIGNMLYCYKGTMPKNTKIEIKEGTVGCANQAFQNCDNLTEIVFPNSFRSIGQFAFGGCTNLRKIVLPDDMSEISLCFSGCTSLEEVVLPKKLKKLDSTFMNCTSLKTITIPDSVTSINNAFCGCTSLQSVKLPNNLKKIGYRTFDGCTSLKTVNIPSGVEEIEDSAFYNCRNLKSIGLPKKLKCIGSAAFSDCIGLSSISIPSSVVEIQYSAFSGAKNLENITFSNNLETVANNAFNDTAWYSSQKNGIIYTGSVAYGYKGDMAVSDLKFKSGTKGIAIDAFSGNDSIKTVTCPRDMRVIGSGAFYGCSNLQSVSFRAGLKLIGMGSFSDCPKLNAVELPSSVNKIYNYAFGYTNYNCNNKFVLVADKDSAGEAYAYDYDLTYKERTKFFIDYKLDGGTNHSSNPTRYEKNSDTITLQNPTKKGYEFQGWYADATMNKKVTQIVAGNKGDVEFYAKWKNTSPVTGITLNKTNASLKKGDIMQLKASVYPTNTPNKSVRWATSNSKVATVTKDGLVKAVGYGIITITCSSAEDSSKKAKCVIKVVPKITAVTIEKTNYTVIKGSSITIKKSVKPDGSEQNVTWKSSDTKIAKVSSKGVVTGIKQGTVTIICSSKIDSSKKATCKVYVADTPTQGFVSRIYSEALGRTPDQSGIEYWTKEIKLKRKTPEEVATFFVFSDEFKAKKYSEEEYVKILYRTFMGREYDQKGLDYWIARLEKGESRKSVLEAFAGCPEFQNIIKSFGL